MLWSPSEVLAYFKDDIKDADALRRENSKLTNDAAFGGFKVWPNFREDFILIAENSEIHGPNPLFTVPIQHSNTDLNLLSTKILSADYLGLSNKKTISLKHAQLLMPDVVPDIHAAINYFLLFDSEARGFIRPTCLAYFTSDKNKLISLAESILKCLSEASSILQHSNILHSIKDLKLLLQEFKSKHFDSSSTEKTINEKAVLQNSINESILQDIQDILDVIESYKGSELFDKRILSVMQNLQKNAISDELRSFFCKSNPASTQQPNGRKYPYQHTPEKFMKNLYLICNDGLVLGLYHLFIMHKHFRRKNENILVSESKLSFKKSGGWLHFGACMKSSPWNSSNSFSLVKCTLCMDKIPRTVCLENENYFHCLDITFENVLLNFINWEKNMFEASKESSSELSSFDISENEGSSSSSGYLSFDYEIYDVTIQESNCGHIVTLDSIWDVLDALEKETPGVESTFLRILKVFDDIQKLLFCLLTRIPIVIISSPEQFSVAQDFLKALSVFIPRRKDETLFVDMDRRKPLSTEHFKSIVAANVCIRNHYVTEALIPFELLPSLCIVNLKDCSLTAPEYAGILLADVNERMRMLPPGGPMFAILVGILSEIQKTVQWWDMVTSSADSSAASSFILSKEFSRLDVQIILKLSNLCKR